MQLINEGDNEEYEKQQMEINEKMNHKILENEQALAQAQSNQDEEDLLSEFENMPEPEILQNFD